MTPKALGGELQGPLASPGMQTTGGRRCFLSQLPPRPRGVQNGLDHPRPSGPRVMWPDTLRGMRREALRRRPELCPARFLISLQVEKTHPKPSLCSGSAGNSPCQSRVHPGPRLLWPRGFRWPRETGWRGTAQGPQRMPEKSLCHQSHQRNTPGQRCQPTTPLISKDCLPWASLFKG